MSRRRLSEVFLKVFVVTPKKNSQQRRAPRDTLHDVFQRDAWCRNERTQKEERTTCDRRDPARDAERHPRSFRRRRRRRGSRKDQRPYRSRPASSGESCDARRGCGDRTSGDRDGGKSRRSAWVLKHAQTPASTRSSNVGGMSSILRGVERAIRGAEMATRERMPVGRGDVREGGVRRAPRDCPLDTSYAAEVLARIRLAWVCGT